MRFLRTVVALCASFKSYRLIRDLPVTTSVKFLLQLIALLTLLVLVSYIPWVLGRAEDGALWVEKHFPAFSIHEAKVTTSVQQPFYVGDDEFLFVLDTTGQITNAAPQAMYGLLVMQDSILFWMKYTNDPPPEIASTRQSLVGFPDGVVNGDYVRRLFRSGLIVGAPLSLIVTTLGGALLCLLQAYLFTIAASWLERRLPSPLRFEQLLNVAIHACTPAAIITAAYLAMRVHGLNLWLIYLIAYAIFLIGATNASREPTMTKESHEDDLL